MSTFSKKATATQQRSAARRLWASDEWSCAGCTAHTTICRSPGATSPNTYVQAACASVRGDDGLGDPRVR